MSGQVVFPPQIVHLRGQVAFLAGPIKGSARWQDEAIEYLRATAPGLNVASPRKALDRNADYTETDYIDQVDWETHHLRRADEKGVVVFWFAEEETHFCERPFARTTRVEFGEWFAHAYLTGTKLVIGLDPMFDGSKYILHRLKEYPQIRTYGSLEETLNACIEITLRASILEACEGIRINPEFTIEGVGTSELTINLKNIPPMLRYEREGETITDPLLNSFVERIRAASCVFLGLSPDNVSVQLP